MSTDATFTFYFLCYVWCYIATELPLPNVHASHDSYSKMSPDNDGILYCPRSTFLVSLWCLFLSPCWLVGTFLFAELWYWNWLVCWFLEFDEVWY
jgi:hypothetical protein